MLPSPVAAAKPPVANWERTDCDIYVAILVRAGGGAAAAGGGAPPMPTNGFVFAHSTNAVRIMFPYFLDYLASFGNFLRSPDQLCLVAPCVERTTFRIAQSSTMVAQVSA